MVFDYVKEKIQKTNLKFSILKLYLKNCFKINLKLKIFSKKTKLLYIII